MLYVVYSSVKVTFGMLISMAEGMVINANISRKRATLGVLLALRVGVRREGGGSWV